MHFPFRAVDRLEGVLSGVTAFSSNSRNNRSAEWRLSLIELSSAFAPANRSGLVILGDQSTVSHLEQFSTVSTPAWHSSDSGAAAIPSAVGSLYRQPASQTAKIFWPWLLGLALDSAIAAAAAAAWWTDDPGVRDVFIAIGVCATATFTALFSVNGFLWLTIKLSQKPKAADDMRAGGRLTRSH